MARLKVTLKRGRPGKQKRQRQTLTGLGLLKRHQSVIVDDNPSIRGMIDKVAHLVEIETVEE